MPRGRFFWCLSATNTCFNWDIKCREKGMIETVVKSHLCFILCMWVFCLHTWKLYLVLAEVRRGHWILQNGITDDCELSGECWVLGTQLKPLEEQPMLSTTDPPLQPPYPSKIEKHVLKWLFMAEEMALKRWLRTCTALQENPAQFPIPTSGSSQLSAAPALGNWYPLLDSMGTCIHMYTGSHIDTHCSPSPMALCVPARPMSQRFYNIPK